MKFPFESFSVVSSYIVQLRNLSQTDFIRNLIGIDHIHVYVLYILFYWATQNHFSDANHVTSGLAEKVLDFSETLIKFSTIVQIGHFRNFKLQSFGFFYILFLFWLCNGT